MTCCSICATAAEPKLIGTGTAVPLSLAEERGLARRTAGSWEVLHESGAWMSLDQYAALGRVQV